MTGMSPIRRWLSRKSCSAGATLFWAPLLEAWRFTPARLRATRSAWCRDVALAKLPDAFHGYRIAQISDIHFDEYTEPSLCAAWWER